MKYVLMFAAILVFIGCNKDSIKPIITPSDVIIAPEVSQTTNFNEINASSDGIYISIAQGDEVAYAASGECLHFANKNRAFLIKNKSTNQYECVFYFDDAVRFYTKFSGDIVFYPTELSPDKTIYLKTVATELYHDNSVNNLYWFTSTVISVWGHEEKQMVGCIPQRVLDFLISKSVTNMNSADICEEVAKDEIKAFGEYADQIDGMSVYEYKVDQYLHSLKAQYN